MGVATGTFSSPEISWASMGAADGASEGIGAAGDWGGAAGMD